MSAPARVLIVAKGLGRGGTERLLVSGLAYFDRARFDPEIAYVLPWKDALVGEVKGHGVPVHCLGQGRAGRLLWPLRMRSLIRRGNFDIVHTHMPVPAVVARLAVANGRPAVVHTEHNVWQRYRAATYWANAVTYHRNAAVLAVSEGVAKSIAPPRPLKGRMPSVEVLIHGIDCASVRRGPEARARGRQLLGIDADAVVAGTVGNLTLKKDQAALLEAIAQLRRRIPKLRLVVIGSGPLASVLKAKAQHLGIDDIVIWAGSRGDVQDLLPAFDIFVLSSRHEGLSIALIEALAAGLPCVATRVGGIPEVVEHEVHGILVPPGDPTVLAAAIEAVLRNPEYRDWLGSQAVSRSERFRLSTAVDRLQEVYDSILVDR